MGADTLPIVSISSFTAPGKTQCKQYGSAQQYLEENKGTTSVKIIEVEKF